MNEADRSAIRETVLTGPDDLTVQLEWNQESLAAHQRVEQRLKAQFRLVDFAGDEDQIRKVQADMKEVRASIAFLEGEITRIQKG